MLFVVAGNEKCGPGDKFIIEQLKRVTVPVFLIVNKIDTLTRDELAAVLGWQFYDFAGIIPISAKEKDNLDEVQR